MTENNEEQKKEDEQKVEDSSENKAEANADSDNGKASEEKEAEGNPSMIEEHKAEREKMEKATAAQKAENDRTEKLIAEKELSGKAQMSAPAPKDVRTDDQKAIDFSDKVDKGEVNPLEMDGYKQ